MALRNFPALVAGPEVGARGYGILRRSGTLKLERQAAARLGDFPLLVSQWANRREPEFAALLPLTDGVGGPSLLVRGAFLGEVANDTVAFAHAILLEAEDLAAIGWRAEALLDLIPLPDGRRDFGAAPVKLEALPPPSAPGRWAGLGLAWQDRIVMVGAGEDPEAALRAILASIDPVEQRSRIRGWATTAGLSTSGRLNPRAMLQLIVVDADAQAGDQYLPARATADGFEGARVPLPETWLAWRRFVELGSEPGIGDAVRAVQWPVDGQRYAAADLLSLAAQSASSVLDGKGWVGLIRRMAAIGNDSGERFAAAFAAGAKDAFAKLVGAADDTGAAFYLTALTDSDPQTAVRLEVGRLAARAGVGKWLTPQRLAVMLDSGFGAALAAADPAVALSELPEASLTLLLPRLLILPHGQRDRNVQRAVLDRMARSGEGDSSDSNTIAEALSGDIMLIGKHELARPEFVDLMFQARRGQFAAWSRRVIDVKGLEAEDRSQAVKVLLAALRSQQQLGGAGT